jgi:hypothetical protein
LWRYIHLLLSWNILRNLSIKTNQWSLIRKRTILILVAYLWLEGYFGINWIISVIAMEIWSWLIGWNYISW